eukprot:gb/GFBE01022960.1/.p1 GENE.gb/GFBE01022960.1/~~gb/GFBE01022960.1/.p1  ORF type:complete len:167 (+),score=53.82 gb/GFBE01022960.1/:1-501(+)
MAQIVTNPSMVAGRRVRGWPLLVVALLFACTQLSALLSFTVPSRAVGSQGAMMTADLASQARPWGSGAAVDARVTRSVTARRIFGLGTSEILVILAVGILFFGPETLKSVAKEAGKAAGDLKDVPKAFEDGMNETDKTKKMKDEDKEEKQEKKEKEPEALPEKKKE